MTDREKILAKIRKCFALSKGAGEHEAAAALAHARRLMDQYDLDQSDVDLAAVGEATAKGGGAWTPSRWESTLVQAICRAIPCEAITNGDQGWSFVGLTPAPEIASYAFVTMYRKLRRSRLDYIANNLRRVRTAQRKTKRADAFAEGWAIAVYSKIAALYPKQDDDGLVIAYIEQRLGKLTTIIPRAAPSSNSIQNDRQNGYCEGRSVELNQGVGAKAKPLELTQ